VQVKGLVEDKRVRQQLTVDLLFSLLFGARRCGGRRC